MSQNPTTASLDHVLLKVGHLGEGRFRLGEEAGSAEFEGDAVDELFFLQNLGVLFIAAAIAAFIGRYARVPTIVAYIVAGLVVGPALGLVEMDHSLELIAEFGIALLLFLVGLELSFDKIKDVGKVAMAAGLGQVVFTAAGGFVLCYLLDFSVMESVFLATGLTFSSTVVVVKLLDQLGDLNRLYGRIAVGIFLVQDIVVIFALTFLTGFGEGEEMTAGNIALGVGKAFGGMGLICVAVLLASRYLLPRPFSWAARSPEVVFLWALCWCFMVVLGAEILGLSLEIGAFLAGISLAQLPYNDDLRRRVHPLMNFFVAVFFLTLGVQMEFGEAREAWMEALILALFVLIGNPLIFLFIITRLGYGQKTAFKTSVTVAQISEFSFIFAAMGVTAGLIGTRILSITALVGVITIVISAYMILQSEKLYTLVAKTGLLRLFKVSGVDAEDTASTGFDGHILVIGMNSFGRSIARALHEQGEQVLAVDTDHGKLADLPCATMIGNVEYESVLEEVGFKHARAVISALQIEDANQLLAYRCKEAGVPYAVHAFDASVVDDLVELDADYLMMPKVDGILSQRRELKREGLL
ncbi:MAG: cation:proton antiporter [Verrucomicrobiota bacterium]